MIHYYKEKNGKLLELQQFEPNCWVNITPPFSEEELEELSLEHDIPLDFLTDSLDIDERSRYEVEDGVRLIVINTPVLNEAESDNEADYITIPIGIILTEDAIITITAFNNTLLGLFTEEKIRFFDPSDATLFVLQIFEQNVYRYLTSLKRLNLKRNAIEKELYDSSRNRELKQLLSLEKSLVYFVTSLRSNELMMLKMKRTDLLKIRTDEEQFDLFEDIIIDNSQALEMANTYTNILASTMEAFASIVSNNLNIVMQRLTLITVILMVPTLVASFYGMNVKGLPFEKSQNAFWYILIFALLISLILAWFFRRKRLF